jgi:hypothetical protein
MTTIIVTAAEHHHDREREKREYHFSAEIFVAHKLRPNVKTLISFPFHSDLGLSIAIYDYRLVKNTDFYRCFAIICK